jgi:hypothetical protein
VSEFGTRGEAQTAFDLLFQGSFFFLPKALRVGDGTVKLVGSFVKFELACLRSLCCFCKKSCDLGGIHRLKIASGIEGLLKEWKRIAARDDDAGGKIANFLVDQLEVDSHLGRAVTVVNR